MHTMEKTPKIVTIIGLVLEGFGALGFFFASWMFESLFTEEFFLALDPNIPLDEIQFILDLYAILGQVFLIGGFVLLVALAINLYLFTGLMNGRYSAESAKKVYTYQFIWGIINVILNTFTGILYIVSGYQGMNGIKEMRDTREGI